MDSREARIECLKLAGQKIGINREQTLELAQAFFEWVDKGIDGEAAPVVPSDVRKRAAEGRKV